MDFHGVKIAVTHFVTQVTHVSRLLEFTVENIKNYLGKCGLRFNKKLAYVSPKILLEKSAKTMKKKIKNKIKNKKKYENVYNLRRILRTKLVLLVE